MKIEVTTNELIKKVEIHRDIGGNIVFKITKDDQQKICNWLNEIRENGESIDTMHFPILTYKYDVSGNVGYLFIIKERITGKELDLTNIDEW